MGVDVCVCEGDGGGGGLCVSVSMSLRVIVVLGECVRHCVFVRNVNFSPLYYAHVNLVYYAQVHHICDTLGVTCTSKLFPYLL